MDDAVEIKFDQIIHLIEQFCIENGLVKSAQRIQDETGIKYSTISNAEEFLSNFSNGKWDLVLEAIEPLDIAPEKLIDLYEHIVLEMIECKEIGIGKTILLNSFPIQLMKAMDINRYLRLEQLMEKTAVTPNDLFGEVERDTRRNELGNNTLKQIAIVPPHRLMDLLGDAIRMQRQYGNITSRQFDIFKGCCANQSCERDEIIQKCVSQTGNNPVCCLESVAFSADGKTMAFGFTTGAVEFWDPSTHAKRSDLKFQQGSPSICCASPVLALSFSHNGELLATGEQIGTLSVFRVNGGQKIASIPNLHAQGITSVCWNEDSTRILSTGYDCRAKMIGLKTFTVLKEFHGHKSFVLSGCFSNTSKQIFTAGADSTVKIWDSGTGECLFTLSPQRMPASVVSIFGFPQKANCFLVCTNGSEIYELSAKGKFATLFSLSSGKFLNCCITARSEYLYAITSDSLLLTIDLQNGRLLNETKVSDNELITIKAHPFMNIVIVSDVKGVIYFYEPATA